MIKTSKKIQTVINIILTVFGILWVMPLLFVILNLFKTKQEYNLGSLWELPVSFNAGIIFSNFIN